MRIVTRIQNDTYKHIYSPVTCHLSLSPVHLSPTPTARATNPPPAKSPTMNSRLVQQDRSSVTEPQKPKHVKPKKWCTPNKKFSYVILAIQSSTRSLQLSWFQLPRETTHKKTDSHGNFKTQAT